VKPGDVGYITYLHGTLYASEYDFDPTFEAYVASPLADFVGSSSPRERLWIAERDKQIIGCIAVVTASNATAQLRWFLVEPGSRGKGLGKWLLNEAITFAKEYRYKSVILWTVRALEAAAHLYKENGFCMVEEKPGRVWGADVIEEKYELRLN